MEILNILWLNWDQYLPLAPTWIDILPSHPHGGVQIYAWVNLDLAVGLASGYIDLCGS
jgi:hypothetical protein